jgi:hypothetical protein
MLTRLPTCTFPAATASSTPRAQKIWLTASTTMAGHSRTHEVRGRVKYACMAATTCNTQMRHTAVYTLVSRNTHFSKCQSDSNNQMLLLSTQTGLLSTAKATAAALGAAPTCVRMLAFMRRSTSPSHASTLPAGIIGLSNGTCACA